MNTSDYRFIYITAKDKAEARAIGKTLCEERLVACANIIDGMESMYWWDNALQQDREAILICKTRNDLVQRLTERVQSLHSYSCPCVVSLPIEAGNLDYLNWIRTQTR